MSGLRRPPSAGPAIGCRITDVAEDIVSNCVVALDDDAFSADTRHYIILYDYPILVVITSPMQR